LEEFEQWLKANLPQVLPKSAIAQAIAYTLKLWPRLKRYTHNGAWQIDNNLVENSIRPVVVVEELSICSVPRTLLGWQRSFIKDERTDLSKSACRSRLQTTVC